MTIIIELVGVKFLVLGLFSVWVLNCLEKVSITINDWEQAKSMRVCYEWKIFWYLPHHPLNTLVLVFLLLHLSCLGLGDFLFLWSNGVWVITDL